MDRSRQDALVTRYWLAGAIGVTVLLGSLVPGPAARIPGLHIIDAGVVVINFLGSLKLAPARFLAALGRWRFIALSLLSVFGIAPLAALGLGLPLGFTSGPDRLAILICAAQAQTLATAIVLTEVAGGDVALAMVLTLTNNLAAVVLTPLVFWVLGGAAIEVDFGRMIGEIALKIALPVALGQVARLRLKGFAERNRRALSVTAQLIILVYIYTGVGMGSERLAGGWLIARVAALAVSLHLFLLLANALVARVSGRDPGVRTAFVLCSSQKTLPVALLIWQSYFPSLPLGPVVAVAYHLTQLLLDSILAPGFRALPLIRTRDQIDRPAR